MHASVIMQYSIFSSLQFWGKGNFLVVLVFQKFVSDILLNNAVEIPNVTVLEQMCRLQQNFHLGDEEKGSEGEMFQEMFQFVRGNNVLYSIF